MSTHQEHANMARAPQPPNRLRRIARRVIRDGKFYMHIGLWRAINAAGLNRTVNRAICRSGRYYQYQPGVCGWCGKRHVDPERFYRRHPWLRKRGRR